MSNLRSLPIRRLEDLPTDGGKTVDALAGGMLRLFVKFEELKRRVEVLEKGHPHRSPDGQKKPPRI